MADLDDTVHAGQGLEQGRARVLQRNGYATPDAISIDTNGDAVEPVTAIKDSGFCSGGVRNTVSKSIGADSPRTAWPPASTRHS